MNKTLGAVTKRQNLWSVVYIPHVMYKGLKKDKDERYEDSSLAKVVRVRERNENRRYRR